VGCLRIAVNREVIGCSSDLTGVLRVSRNPHSFGRAERLALTQAGPPFFKTFLDMFATFKDT